MSGGPTPPQARAAADGAALEAVLHGIEALAPTWAARAGAADRDGSVAVETAAQLRALGAHRLLQPRAFGGQEATIRAHVDAVTAAAAGDPAVGWCLAVWSVHNWMLALFEPQAQAEVWEDPAAVLSASIAPRNTFVAGAGGDVVVGGRYPFASGCDHADWFLISGFLARGDGAEPVMAVVPRAAATIDHDSWQVAGLRGTGSKDLVIAEGTVVPAHRTMWVSDAARRRAPGQLAHPVPLYLAPYRPVAGLVLAPPAVGAAKAALARFVERLDGHHLPLGGYPNQRHDPAARLRVSESAADADAAELVLANAADLVDRLGHEAAPRPLDDARVLRDTAYGVRLAATAVDRLFEASGGGALGSTEAMQRLWRDVHAARIHAILTWDAAARGFADALLGPLG